MEFGYPTIGNADLQYKSHHEKFKKPGKVLENGVEKTVDNVEEYINSKLANGPEAKYTNEEIKNLQIYIEVDLIDQIGDNVQQKVYEKVITETQGLDLSQQQLYALTAITYNFGHLPVRNSKTFKQVYEAGAGLYEIDSWEHDKYIWDNWWALLGGESAGHIPSRDASFETYVKGVYDFSESAAGKVFGRSYYIYYTQEQLNAYDYAPNKPITRTAENEEEIFTYNEIELYNYDGEAVIAAGYQFPHYLQKNYAGSYGSSTISASGCGPTSMAMILAGFCNDYSITPVTFIENLEEYYPSWESYYVPGAGSIRGAICDTQFLAQYYNCKSTYVSDNAEGQEQALKALAEGKAVLGGEEGHLLAIIPVPDEYKNMGYAFYVLDSYRGHDGPFKSVSDFINSTTATKLIFRYIIEPIN